jgi:nucleoid-associated protein Lsr2
VHVADRDVAVRAAILRNRHKAAGRVDPVATCAAGPGELNRQPGATGNVKHPVTLLEAEPLMDEHILTRVVGSAIVEKSAARCPHPSSTIFHIASSNDRSCTTRGGRRRGVAQLKRRCPNAGDRHRATRARHGRKSTHTPRRGRQRQPVPLGSIVPGQRSTGSVAVHRDRHDTVAVGQDTAAVPSDIVDPGIERQAMAKVTVEVLVDDLDGSEGAETVRLGWNGDWREIDLSKKNRASLSRALDRYWNAARPVAGERQSSRRRGSIRTTSSRSTNTSKRDPKVIRAWATEHGIAVPARGRIPGEVEQRYNLAHARS